MVPTNVELEKGGVGEGGAVELWERRADGGLRFGLIRLKVEPLSCVLLLGNDRAWIYVLEEGEGRAREGCVLGNGRAVYRREWAE
ncbi:hypothetical protein SO802_010722 [Lithocarpus litseifolius]|uniref:Uncharacterized protein n=1 Tax=Lithocarpus litseifolius TaxID=425828 RepID=A0AAW2DJ65_9ROSI